MRNVCASQSHGCCFDIAIFQQLFAMGAEQALQQNLETQHQPAPATPVHVPEGGGDENEEQWRRAACRQMGRPAPGAPQ